MVMSKRRTTGLTEVLTHVVPPAFLLVVGILAGCGVPEPIQRQRRGSASKEIPPSCSITRQSVNGLSVTWLVTLRTGTEFTGSADMHFWTHVSDQNGHMLHDRSSFVPSMSNAEYPLTPTADGQRLSACNVKERLANLFRTENRVPQAEGDQW
jgi:hypothetical protein